MNTITSILAHKAVDLNPENIPNGLKELDQWVVWKPEHKDGKTKKPPYNAITGRNAVVTNIQDWATFEQAFEVMKSTGVGGVGFVFSDVDPYCGIDLDRCRDAATGQIEAWAQEIIDRIDSYTEISPSGTGIHIFVKAKLPGNIKKSSGEMYVKAHHLTVTGERLTEYPKDILERQEPAEWLFTKLGGVLSQKEQQVIDINSKRAFPPVDLMPRELTNEEIADVNERLKYAMKNDRFKRFWNGEWRPEDIKGDGTESGADFSFCNNLAHWMDKDPLKMDYAFRQSKMMRPKWDEKRGSSTWGWDTILKVIATKKKEGFKLPGKQKQKPEDFREPFKVNGKFEWLVSQSGIVKKGKTVNKRGKIEIEPDATISITPVVIKGKVKDVLTDEIKFEIVFLNDNRLECKVIDSAALFFSSEFKQLRRLGVSVAQSNTMAMIDYFTDLEMQYKDSIKTRKSISRFGWFGDNFIPGLEGDVTLNIDEPGIKSLASVIKPFGTFEGWKTEVEPFLGFPSARVLMAASFLSPLMPKIGERSFVIHNWERTEAGKSAALILAMSIWGKSTNSDLLASANSTMVGFERRAAILNNLPVAINELQTVTQRNREDFANDLIYMAAEQHGKQRGKKEGGLQELSEWWNIWLTNGEEPLTEWLRTAGAHNRLIEICGKIIPDKVMAGKLYSMENFGHAGIEFIKAMRDRIDDLKQLKQQILTDTEKAFPDSLDSHKRLTALIAACDKMSQKIIFGRDVDPMDVASAILTNTLTKQENDEGSNHYDKLISWFHQHPGMFLNGYSSDKTLREIYGYIQEKHLLIIPTVFEEYAANVAKCSSKKIIRDLDQMGVLETMIEAGKKRYKVKKRVENNAPARFISIQLPQD